MLRSSNLGFWLKGVLIFPLLSGLLLLLGWPPIGIFPVMFIGLVPLFLALDEIEKIRKGKYFAVFISSFIGHFLWIGYAMKWLQITSPQSYLTGITLEAFSLSLAMIPAVWFGIKYGKHIRFVFFAAAWLTIELLNQNWLFGTPYFALGNGFGMLPSLIQHYEFIGIEGGTLWLLVSNYLLYVLVIKVRKKESVLKYSLVSAAVIVVPLLVSISMYSIKASGESMKVSVLHTYLQPRETEVTKHPSKMTDSLFRMSEPGLIENSRLIVWPEVIINNMGWLMSISQEEAFTSIYAKLKKYPNTTICSGGYGFSVDKNGNENPYSTYDSIYKYYFLTHNIALSITYGERSPIRSKKKFVPFQERIPLLKEFPFMVKFADVVGANAKITYFENGVEVHKTKTGVTYTPMLCYESIFPLDMAEKAKEVQLITILANENWNRDLSGSEQYLYNHVAMAIQSRIPIAKSSNSGISCIIDKKGNVLVKRKGRDTGLITATVELADKATLYSMISGLIYWMGVIVFIPMSCLFLFFSFSRILKKKN